MHPKKGGKVKTRFQAWEMHQKRWKYEVKQLHFAAREHTRPTLIYLHRTQTINIMHNPNVNANTLT
jgi:hypothetical protein